MRVAIVHSDGLPVPPVLGGAIGQMVCESVCGMPDVDWTVISPWDDALSDRAWDRAIFRHVNVARRVAAVRNAMGGQLNSLRSEKDLRQFCYVDGAVEILNSVAPDVIQVENRPAFAPFIKQHVPCAKLLLYLHNTCPIRDPRIHRAMDLCDGMVFVSRFLAEWYGQRFPACRSRGRVIYNGVDASIWRPVDRTQTKTRILRQQFGLRAGRTVLFVGRTHPDKGVHHLLEAMQLVRHLLPDVKCLVVGSPFFGAVSRNAYLRHLERQVKHLGDGVVFTGFVDRAQLPMYYGLADVVAVPSVFEDPFPTVVLEAMACGAPVVGSRRGGISEMIAHKESGLLVDDPSDAGDLALKILTLLEDADLRKTLGEQSRRDALKRFAPEQRWGALRALYQAVGARDG